MKKMSVLVVVVASILCSCSHTLLFGVGHDFAHYNLDKRLENDDYRKVRSVTGKGRAIYFLGLGGLSNDAKKLNETSYLDMVYNAQLKPNQAIIEVTSEMKMAIFPLIAVRTIYTTGTVIEFASDKPKTIIASNTDKQQEKDVVHSTYKIGDYYSNGDIKGVVVDISEDGAHGKIVSLASSQESWWTAQSRTANGKVWSIPSLEEMQSLYKNIEIINNAIKKSGGVEILPYEQYWTSTEKDSNNAVAVQSTYYCLVNKSTPLRVILMARF